MPQQAVDGRVLDDCGGGCSRRCRQSASAERWLTAALGFVETLNSHGVGLKDLLNDVTISVVELPTQFSPSKGGEIAHPIDEKLRVGDAVFLFQFV